MSNAEIVNLLIGYGFLTAGIFGATEILQKVWIFKRIDNEVLALLFGIVAYPTLTALGVLPLLEGIPVWKQVVASAIFGLVAIGAAGLVHDKVGNPIKKMFT